MPFTVSRRCTQFLGILLLACSRPTLAQCYPPGPCGGGAGCVPIDTTLPPTSSEPVAADGWNRDGGPCGTKPSGTFLRKPCGNRLSNSVCIFFASSEAGAGGTPQTCATAVVDESRLTSLLRSIPPAPTQSDQRIVKEAAQDFARSRVAATYRRAPEVAERLVNGAHELADMQQIELSAKAFVGAPGQREQYVGTFHYVGAGPLWKLSITSDPELNLSSDIEAGFDGLTNYLYVTSTGVLTERRDPLSQLPLAVPNALQLALRAYLPWLPEASAENSLASFSDALRGLDPVDFWAQAPSRDKTAVIGAGPTVGGVPTYSEMRIDSVGRPRSIENRREDGVVIRRLSYQYERRHRGLPLPTQVVIEAMDSPGAPPTRLRYEMVWRLEFDENLLARTGEIGNRAHIVIDADALRFLKHPQLSRQDQRQ